MTDLRQDELDAMIADLSPEHRSLLTTWLQARAEASGHGGRRAPAIQLPLVPIHTDGARPPFFSVHSHGGGTFYYLPLSQHLGADQPFYALQARGLADDQEPHRTVEEMAAYYINAIRSVQPTGPYLLAGWCLGGVIAFEMAQQLRRQGEQIALLALLDSDPGPYPPGGCDMTRAIFSLLGTAHVFLRKRFRLAESDLAKLSEEEQLSYLIEQLRGFDAEKLRWLGLVTTQIEPSTLRRILRIYGSNYEAILAYRQRIYPGRIAFFRASDPYPLNPTEHFADQWRRYTAEPLEVHDVQGNHITFLTDPVVGDLAGKLRACITRAIEGALGESAAPGRGERKTS